MDTQRESKVKNPIIGYIVLSGTDGPALELCANAETLHKILLRGDDVSVFATRKDAREAIEATKEWAELHRAEFGDKWVDDHRYSVWPLRKAEL